MSKAGLEIEAEPVGRTLPGGNFVPMDTPKNNPSGNSEKSVPFVSLCFFSACFALAILASKQHFLTMQSHELLREVIQASSAKQIASDMGLSVSMIYKWAEPAEGDNGSGASNPLDRIASLQRCTNDTRIIQWLCHDAGGFFVKNPKKLQTNPDSLLPATNQIVQEFADLLGVIALAVADNQVSKAEATDIRNKWEELKTVTEEFVLCCEHGNFNKLPIRRDASGVTLHRPAMQKPVRP